MKNINLKKIGAIITSGFILLTVSGCKSEVSKEQENTTTSLVEESKDEQVMKYFEDLQSDVNKFIEEKNLKELPANVVNKIKESLITGIDFIFYDTEINGITFKELSDETKKDIMKIVSSVDVKIEEQIPNYKENIKNKFGEGYDFISDKLKEGIDTIDSKLESKYGQKYDEIKEKASDVKDKIGTTFDVIKDKTSDSWSKVKKWYEDKTDKR